MWVGNKGVGVVVDVVTIFALTRKFVRTNFLVQ